MPGWPTPRRRAARTTAMFDLNFYSSDEDSDEESSTGTQIMAQTQTPLKGEPMITAPSLAPTESMQDEEPTGSTPPTACPSTASRASVGAISDALLAAGAQVGSRVAIDWGAAGGWREGCIIEMRTELEGVGYRVSYDEPLPRSASEGGSSTWHGPGVDKLVKGARLLAMTGSTWTPLQLRCVVSMERLTAPGALPISSYLMRQRCTLIVTRATLSRSERQPLRAPGAGQLRAPSASNRG